MAQRQSAHASSQRARWKDRQRSARYDPLQRREVDPTHTTTVRRNYAQALRGGWARIAAVIRAAVGEGDIFGLDAARDTGGRPRQIRREQAREPMATPRVDARVTANGHGRDGDHGHRHGRDRDALVEDPPARNFEFARDDQKIDRFLDWLDGAERDEVLSVIDRHDNRYIRAAYERGDDNAIRWLNQAGVDMDRGAMRTFDVPVHQDKVQNLYTRNFRELEGITDAVDQQISRELSQGLIEGINPNDMAERLAGRVESVGETRATVMARTEVINAHNEAALTTYEEALGPEAEVQLRAEILTAEDDRVCDECEPRHGDTMHIEDAHSNGPPFHPQCRCTVVPYVPVA